jgi:hypothetical protein
MLYLPPYDTTVSITSEVLTAVTLPDSYEPSNEPSGSLESYQALQKLSNTRFLVKGLAPWSSLAPETLLILTDSDSLLQSLPSTYSLQRLPLRLLQLNLEGYSRRGQQPAIRQ